MRLGISLGLTGAVLAASAAPAQSSSVNDPIAISNVTIITMDRPKLIENGTVVVANGKISAVLHAGAAPPKNVRIIDGRGGYIIPGLIDAHVHYPYYGVAKPANYLRYGVTTVFSLGSPERELEELVETRGRIARGQWAGPHIYATGPSIANHVKLQTPAEVEPFLSSLRSRGFEFVKVYNEIPQPVFDAVVAGAHRRGMGVFGHMPRTFPPEYTLSHGLDVLAHMEELFFTEFGGARDRELATLAPDWTPDYSKIDPVLDLIAKNRVAIIPNLNSSMNFQNLWVDEDRELSSPDAQYIKPDLLRTWRENSNAHRDQIEKRTIREEIKFPLIRVLTYRAWKKGIMLLAGTDAPLPAIYPGRSIHHELRLLVAAGLPNEDALRTATANGGEATKRFVDHNACIGIIKTGCEADLVLLRANPLEDIRSTATIAGVMTDGRWYLPEQLEQLSKPD